MRFTVGLGALAALAAMGCGAPGREGYVEDAAGVDVALQHDAAGDDAAALVDGASADAAVQQGCGACGVYSGGVTVGRVTDSAANELSGVAASRARDDLAWVHNDSGDRARVFAIGFDGAVRAEVRFEGAAAVDYEDLAVGPCAPGGEASCVVVGDIGDNDRARGSVVLYRFEEAEVIGRLREGERVTMTLRPAQMVLRYPDGAHNAEALVLLPGSGELGIVTKTEDAPIGVYATPRFVPDGEATLARVGTLTLPPGGTRLVTGADWHPCLPKLLVRTYDRLWEYDAAAGATDPLASAAASTAPTRRSVAVEAQGEAVGWLASGRGYLTVSEGRNANLSRSGCVE